MRSPSEKKGTTGASDVLFASACVKSLNARETLPAKFTRMLKRSKLESFFKDKSVAIKMHVGGGIGYSTIHPIFVRSLIQEIKEAGGRPFITDGSGSIEGRAHIARGYTEEVLDAPVRPAAGVNEKYFYRRKVGYNSLKDIEVCGEIHDADAMVVFSHGKGHGMCAFGGAVKNIAMGCVTTRSRGAIHGIESNQFKWDAEKCTHCYTCRDNCPGNAISFDEQKRFNIFFHNCRYCMHCVTSCPVHAIENNPVGWKYFQEGMAAVTKTVLESFEPSRVFYVTVLTQITPLCDCWGFTTPAIVPDIGIVASEDIAAVEQAALDLIGEAKYIEGSLPDQIELREGTHLLQRIWGKDPYVQVEQIAKRHLGNRKYNLKEIQ